MLYKRVKYQGETSMNSQYTLKKMKDRKVKQVLPGGGPQCVCVVNGKGEGG
jgi:hypothetical protein